MLHFIAAGGEDPELQALGVFTASAASGPDYALDAQALVRLLARGWPDGHQVALGYDHHTLVAVAHWVYLEEFVYLQVVAVALSHQGRGVGAALMGAAMRDIERATSKPVMAKVHRDNAASYAMLTRCGFTWTEMEPPYKVLFY